MSLDNLDNLVDKLNPLKTKALSLVHQATEKASSADNYLMERIGNSIGSSIAVWLNQHPLVAWLVSHPVMAMLISLVAIILVVRLLLTIYRAIASAIDRLWLAILRSPLRLLKFLFGWQPKPKTITSNTTVTNYEVTSDSQQLQEIMARLDQIQQQQQEIIRELALLKQPLTIEPQHLQLVEKKISNQ
ncbi:hypothetical protein C7B62_06050 [Pleurocapsa sp. CCALA 161]|uniref:hypothetical protein n=1 Tax=Pleurocapsa sp. CCALA 161 TaxID=2107688 RepID=UPI000D06D2B4|nr:hypothetical protein [Pleurocapsa sp. CCALA 161]PSB11353.1 hypothetical protein C7B62_06050 [Pleurocapsa sp. CCALA 161]